MKPLNASSISAAFARTSAHPLSGRVRLARHPRDIAAVLHPDVTCVQLARIPPPTLLEAVAGLGRVAFPTGGSDVKISLEHARFLPLAIRCDMERTRRLLQHVTQKQVLRKDESIAYQDYPAGYVLPRDAETRKGFAPHADAPVIQAVCVYTANPKLGMEWYPKVYTKEAEELFRQHFCTAAKPSDIKQLHNVQYLPPLHIAFFKGYKPRQEDRLVHGVPTPVGGARRVVHVAGVR
jgi:hypothetical protein